MPCVCSREWSDIGDRLGGKQTVRLLGEPKMQMQVFPKLQLEKLRLVVKIFLVPQLEKEYGELNDTIGWKESFAVGNFEGIITEAVASFEVRDR